MPAGVGWGEYLKFFSCAMLFMMAGSHVVHTYYKPLKDLKEYIANEEKQLEQNTKNPSNVNS